MSNISTRIIESIKLNEDALPTKFISEDMTIKDLIKLGDVRSGAHKVDLSGYTDDEIMDFMILTRAIHDALGTTQITINEELRRRKIEAQAIFSREHEKERNAPKNWEEYKYEK